MLFVWELTPGNGDSGRIMSREIRKQIAIKEWEISEEMEREILIGMKMNTSNTCT